SAGARSTKTLARHAESDIDVRCHHHRETHPDHRSRDGPYSAQCAMESSIPALQPVYSTYWSCGCVWLNNRQTHDWHPCLRPAFRNNPNLSRRGFPSPDCSSCPDWQLEIARAM